MSARRSATRPLTVVLAVLASLVASATAAVGAEADTLTPSITEHALASSTSQPEGITAGPDGNLWFTEARGTNGNGAIGRISTAGSETDFSLPSSGSAPLSISPGPDGDLWFTEMQGNRIGQISTTGTLVEHSSVPAPVSIVDGGDGALWFTAPGPAALTRMTTAGAVTPFSLPTTSSGPEGIALGPDGNLWVVENSADKIARVTPTGTATEFRIPTSSSGATSIAAGPDGNLWFTEYNVGQVGRITPAGAITEFALPSSASGPIAIVAGADGALWFTEQAANSIGRITVAGATSQYPLPSASSGPFGIAAGPDGAIWFTEASAGRVASITTPPGVTPGVPADLGSSTATISFDVTAPRQGATVVLQYGLSSTYGATSPTQSFATASSSQPGTVALAGLAPASTYHYRVLATNSTGTTYGADRTFTTASGPPSAGAPPSGSAPATVASSGPPPSIPPASSPPVRVLGGPFSGLPKLSLVSRPAPVVTISSAPIRVGRNGVAPIQFGCPSSSTTGCRGVVTLTLVAAAPPRRSRHKAARAHSARCGRGCRPLGTQRFTAAAGKKKTVNVSLNPAGRRLLIRAARLSVRVAVTTQSDGKVASASRVISLFAAAPPAQPTPAVVRGRVG